MASGQQQAAGLGARVGQPLAAVQRRQRDAARQWKAAARGAVQGLRDAARNAPALARPLDRVGQLREGARSRARLQLPVLWMDDRSEPSRQRRLSDRQENRVGLQEPARPERAGSGAVHQAAGISQRVEQHPEGHMTRRDFITQALAVSAAVPALARAQTAKNPLAVRVGMTDWNLGQRGDIGKIALAREIGLDGIQVSLQFPTDGRTPTLRDPATQAAFRRAALDNGIQICSLAIGSPGKSRLPLHTNPAAAILLTEAVEVARNLGTNNILLPILGDSHIDMTSQTQVDTFVAMMKEVARYAEKYDVVVAIEDWISAEDNIRLLDAIGSNAIAVYYDAHNIVLRVKDIYAEPKLLGRRINQIHVKNANMLLSTPGGRLDWPRMAKEFYDIGYRGWYVLETNSPTNDIVADTRANIEYVKKTFRIPPLA